MTYRHKFQVLCAQYDNHKRSYWTGRAAIPKMVKLAMAWVHFYGCNYPWENVE